MRKKIESYKRSMININVEFLSLKNSIDRTIINYHKMRILTLKSNLVFFMFFKANLNYKPN